MPDRHTETPTAGPTRWLLLGPLPPPLNGQSQAVQGLVDLLAEEVRFDVIDSSGRDGRALAPNTASPRRGVEVVRFQTALRRRLVAERTPLLYANMSFSPLGHLRDVVTFAAAIPKGHPVVVWPHNDLRGLAARGLTARTLGWLASRVERWVFLSRILAGAVVRWVPQSRIAIVPNLVPPELLVSSEEVESKLAGWRPGGELRILWVANMTREKGWEDLLEAAARLVADGASIRVTFVGGWFSAEDERAFGEAVATRGLGERVRHLGAVHDRDRLRSLYLGHQVFALPSWNEAAPLTVIEAMNAGCAVVATRVGGVPDLVQDGRTGILVPPREPRALAEALARYRSLDRLTAAASAARRRYVEHLGREVVRERWLEVLGSGA